MGNAHDACVRKCACAHTHNCTEQTFSFVLKFIEDQWVSGKRFSGNMLLFVYDTSHVSSTQQIQNWHFNEQCFQHAIYNWVSQILCSTFL